MFDCNLAGGGRRTRFVLAAAFAVGCAGTPTEAPARSERAPGLAEQAPAEPIRSGYHGPKKTIAVAKFDANGRFRAVYGGWDVGGGLSAQLATELSKSPRFVTIERPDLGFVLREQELAAENLTSGPTAPPTGELLGAQLLVRGSVTEFDDSTSGGGIGIGHVFTRGIGGSISPGLRRGHVAIDLRVVDTTTGRIVAAESFTKKLTRVAVSARVSRRGTHVGGNGFKKTALGSAARDTIQQAVVYLERTLEQVPWQATVAQVRGERVYVNAGQRANLHVGDRLSVYRVADSILDPFTREVIGLEEERIGSVHIDRVALRYSTATFDGTWAPRVGDTLRFEQRSVATASHP